MGSENIVPLIVTLVLAAGILGLYIKYGVPTERAKRRAERKVMMSDPIQRADINVLRRTNSEYLSDAVALRRAQIQQGRDPDRQPPREYEEAQDNEEGPSKPHIGFR